MLAVLRKFCTFTIIFKSGSWDIASLMEDLPSNKRPWVQSKHSLARHWGTSLESFRSVEEVSMWLLPSADCQHSDHWSCQHSTVESLMTGLWVLLLTAIRTQIFQNVVYWTFAITIMRPWNCSHSKNDIIGSLMSVCVYTNGWYRLLSVGYSVHVCIANTKVYNVATVSSMWNVHSCMCPALIELSAYLFIPAAWQRVMLRCGVS